MTDTTKHALKLRREGHTKAQIRDATGLGESMLDKLFRKHRHTLPVAKAGNRPKGTLPMLEKLLDYQLRERIAKEAYDKLLAERDALKQELAEKDAELAELRNLRTLDLIHGMDESD